MLLDKEEEEDKEKDQEEEEEKQIQKWSELAPVVLQIQCGFFTKHSPKG